MEGSIAGYTKGVTPMPVSMGLLGKQYDESLLINLAYRFESHSAPRLIPRCSYDKYSVKLMKMTILQLNNLLTQIAYYTYTHKLKDSKAQTLSPQEFTAIIKPILN